MRNAHLSAHLRWKLQYFFFFCFMTFYNSIAYANPLEFYYQRYLDKKVGLKATRVTSIQAHTFNQFVDHDKPELGTFGQRYYVDETFSTSNQAPVFFYICGEAECHATELSRGSLRALAAKFHAKLVALEHRYYGKSLPRPTFSTENLKYLTTELAVRDLAEFQKYLTATNHWTGKWFTIGGSYAGSLSAYYRLKYPNLVAGALASSAPVIAKENFEEYDAHVTKVAGPKCATDMRSVVREVETAINNKEVGRLAEIKEKFKAAKVNDDRDFLSLVAEIGATAIQYGMRDEFCHLLSQNSGALEGYAAFARTLYTRWQLDPLNLIPQGAVSENPDDYLDLFGARQWYYQTCTEYGYWQIANNDAAKSTRSALLNSDYEKDACLRLFGIKDSPKTDYINQHFYQPLLDEGVSNIFFTNGANDPWSNLSLIDANGNTTNPNLGYHLIDGAAHCADLRAPTDGDSESLKTARTRFNALVERILQD